MRNFRQMLEARWHTHRTMVCVGLDSDLSRVPKHVLPQSGDKTSRILPFNTAIVDATKDLVCAYKPNAAFYEAHGSTGWNILKKTVSYIHTVAPDVPIILDAKRADIGNTNNGYVQGLFDELEFDAITIHPYLGREAVQPFLDRAEKGAIILCRTSNTGAGEFQDMIVDGKRLYERVAEHVTRDWNKNGNCCVVVGATYPEELKVVREIVGDMPILVPGIGAQGGDLEATVRAGKRREGYGGMIINSSREIIFASKEADFAEAARKKTLELRDAINALY